MSCELSPSASAFSSMLLAFVGSVITGLSSGALIAFFTGWISWLSVIRILAAGVFELYLTWKAGTNFGKVEPLDKGGPRQPYESIDINEVTAYDLGPGATNEGYRTGGQNVEQQRYGLLDSTQQQPTIAQPFTRKTPFRTIERNVNATGWLGWTWSAIYMPVSETIWVCVNLSSPSSSGVQYLVRALAIGVSALALTYDYKQRYGAALGARWGSWAFVTFNLWNASACVLLGVEALVLLIYGAMNLSRLPIPLLVAYPIFSIVWAVGSWIYLPPVDGERPWPVTKHGKVWTVIAGALMGAFAGLFVAAPAFLLWRDAEFANRTGAAWGEEPPAGLALGEFLACEGVSVWAKFAAVMP